MKKIVVILIMGVFVLLSSRSLAQQTAVYVAYRADDNIGSRLVYALRERLRSSQGLKIVDTEDESILKVHIVTIDPDERRLNTVYSAVVTMNEMNNSAVEIYLNNYVGVWI